MLVVLDDDLGGRDQRIGVEHRITQVLDRITGGEVGPIEYPEGVGRVGGREGGIGIVKSKINSYDLAQCAPVIHSRNDIRRKNVALKYNRISFPKYLLDFRMIEVHCSWEIY